jgi:hypothetical protein
MKTRNEASCISFCSCNAGRLITEKGNKLHDENFIDQIKEFDRLSETHVGYERTVDVEHCFYYPLWRTRNPH